MAKKRTFNFGRLKLFVLIGVLIYVCVTFVNQQSLLSSQLQKQAALTEQEDALQREIEYYKNELDYIGTDEYVEQEARTRFGWLKPGEIKYVEGTESSAPSADPTADLTEAPESENSANPEASAAIIPPESTATIAPDPTPTPDPGNTPE